MKLNDITKILLIAVGVLMCYALLKIREVI